MNRKTSKILSILAGFAFVGAGYASAATACESAKVMDTNNYGVMFGTKGAETKKLSFCGLIQADHNLIVTEDHANNDIDPDDRNNFLMRRVRVGFDADLGNDWRGVAVLHFNGSRYDDLYPSITAIGDDQTSTPTVVTTANKHGIFGIDRAYIEKSYNGTSFKAGYKKVNFGREENTEACHLKAIERSIANEFMNGYAVAGNIAGSSLGIGSRHVGLYMDGMYNGIGYGLSVVNGFQGNGLSKVSSNELGVYANLYYACEFNCMDLEFGINGGFQPKGNNHTLTFVNFGTDAQLNKRASIAAINPYIMATWQKFSVLAEFLGAKVERGAIDGFTDASPYGVTVMPSYMVNDQLELVGRYSYLDTDSRGARISTVVPGGVDTKKASFTNVTATNAIASAGDVYSEAFAWYAGFNYFMMNKAIKLSGGYEYIEFSDRHDGSNATTTVNKDGFKGGKTSVHAIRTRVQLVF